MNRIEQFHRLDLDIQISDEKTVVSARPGSIGIPIARIEEQEEFGDRAIAELCDSRLLQGIKSSLTVIDMPQSAEWKGKATFVAEFPWPM